VSRERWRCGRSTGTPPTRRRRRSLRSRGRMTTAVQGKSLAGHHTHTHTHTNTHSPVSLSAPHPPRSDYSSDYSDWTADAGINLEPPKKSAKGKKKSSGSEEDGEKKRGDGRKERKKEKAEKDEAEKDEAEKDEAAPKKKQTKEKRKVGHYPSAICTNEYPD